tara:strand:- start:3070 stop:3249 length:180 start_codon:yes stop_codon:yes gene_type:complete
MNFKQEQIFFDDKQQGSIKGTEIEQLGKTIKTFGLSYNSANAEEQKLIKDILLCQPNII